MIFEVFSKDDLFLYTDHVKHEIKVREFQDGISTHCKGSRRQIHEGECLVVTVYFSKNRWLVTLKV